MKFIFIKDFAGNFVLTALVALFIIIDCYVM